MTITVSAFRVRAMTLADIPAVVEIERASFPTSWPPSAYRRELAENKLARYIVVVEQVPAPDERHNGPGGGGAGNVVRRFWAWLNATPAAAPPVERIVGFLGLWLMVDEGHIVTVASRPDMRRRGVGELLVAEALAIARTDEIERVTLEVRASNTPAQALYDKYGFARLGIRKRYYTDNGEDALIMTTPRLDDPAYTARLADLRRQYEARFGRVASIANT